MRGLSRLNLNRARIFTAGAGALVIALAAYGVVGGVNAGPVTPTETTAATSTDIELDSEIVEIGPRRGQQAPQIEVETYTSDGVFRLADHLGHPVVINFWYPSCAGCRIEKPFIKAAHEKFRDQGVVFLGVQSLILDTVEDGLKFLEENGLEYPNIADDWVVALRYQVTGYPQTVFLNSDHTVRTRTGTIKNQGAIDQIIGGILALEAG